MNMTLEDKLKQLLKTKKVQLEVQQVNYRISVAEHNVKKEMLVSEIDDIENLLEGGK